MGKKSEARAQRKAQAQEKFEASKPKFVAAVNGSDDPRLGVDPEISSSPRVAPHLARRIAEQELRPKTAVDGGRFSSRVTWCITQADRAEAWSWGEPREWQEDEWESIIHPPLNELSKLTWKEIDQFSSDSGHRMHHGHEISDLVSEAQERWKTISLEQYDSVFRFRLGGTRRVWGFIVQAHFHAVWWDRFHSIYPTEQS